MKTQEIYLTVPNMKLEKIFIKNKKVTQFEVIECFHATLYKGRRKSKLMFYTEDEGQIIYDITKYKYENRIFKAYIEGQEFQAIRLKVHHLNDGVTGRRLSKI